MSTKPNTNGKKEISFSMWEDMVAACKDRNLDPRAILTPEKYKDDVSAARRRFVLAALLTKGWPQQAIRSLCPCDRVTLWRASINVQRVSS